MLERKGILNYSKGLLDVLEKIPASIILIIECVIRYRYLTYNFNGRRIYGGGDVHPHFTNVFASVIKIISGISG